MYPLITNATAISFAGEPPDIISDPSPPPLPPKNVDNHHAPSLPQKHGHQKKRFRHVYRRTTSKFSDGTRSIDFVIVYDKDRLLTDIADQEKRRIFEENLIKDGLELEYDDQDEHISLNFVKIHATREICRRYSEILRLRMPMKKLDKYQEFRFSTPNLVDFVSSKWKDLMTKLFYADPVMFPPSKHYFTAIYSRDKEYLFDIDSPEFFTPTVRSRIVQFILDRTLFSLNELDPTNFGIEHLINDDVYCAAYPLHEGFCEKEGSTRYILYRGWASLRNTFKYQPLDYVKEYFGVKIALYFTWLGFYTYMLIPASAVGLLCFMYSWSTSYSNVACDEICNENVTIKMCPLCDYNCDFWEIQDSCVHSRVTYLFDNATTVFFSIFMCFWCTMFLELWKRNSAEITHRWDLTEFDKLEEYPRPEYLARLKHVTKKTVNLITNDAEPKVPFWTMRLPMTIFSFSVVILLVAVAFAAVAGVVLYRLSILAAFYACQNKFITNYALILTNTTAAFINLLFIVVLNVIYSWLAKYLTELELHRTQTEFDDSLTLKMYLFEFVNYYSSIIYIAFFKGKFTGSPSHYFRFFHHRQEECGLGGCLTELCIQLAIIMVGKQVFNAVLEIVHPIFYRWWNTRRVKGHRKTHGSYGTEIKQWVEDYKLVPFGPQALFPEYLEMVLQYGFVTIFVSAFPLAPLFALLNNILEVRLDARKFLTFYRRPVSQRVKNIGIWYRILDSIGKIAVFTNSFILAFTSDFVPKLVYVFIESKDYSLTGYLEYSLSYMNVSHLDLPKLPPNPENITVCRYKDFRNPIPPYSLSWNFWIILVGRLLFMLVFQPPDSNTVYSADILFREDSSPQAADGEANRNESTSIFLLQSV
ncbi:hypothetical protein V9T40_013576 [Parthenolecanium corni]|uniref:Anoctamin n=1 Tax=Parthenolecanium corni TaxID=536013 RepID=A0AAN9Y2R3_9HEMI